MLNKSEIAPVPNSSGTKAGKKIIKNILLVDDDEATNLFNKRVIENSGLAEKVTVALSGIEALSFLRTKFIAAGNEPELILLDAAMPEMDGWKFADEFQKLSERKKMKTKIIMLTGTPAEIEKIYLKTYPQISGYKIKPLTEEMLLDIMHKFIEENSMEKI